MKLRPGRYSLCLSLLAAVCCGEPFLLRDDGWLRERGPRPFSGDWRKWGRSW